MRFDTGQWVRLPSSSLLMGTRIIKDLPSTCGYSLSTRSVALRGIFRIFELVSDTM